MFPRKRRPVVKRIIPWRLIAPLLLTAPTSLAAQADPESRPWRVDIRVSGTTIHRTPELCGPGGLYGIGGGVRVTRPFIIGAAVELWASEGYDCQAIQPVIQRGGREFLVSGQHDFPAAPRLRAVVGYGIDRGARLEATAEAGLTRLEMDDRRHGSDKDWEPFAAAVLAIQMPVGIGFQVGRGWQRTRIRGQYGDANQAEPAVEFSTWNPFWEVAVSYAPIR
jgi:hypothetical protein